MHKKSYFSLLSFDSDMENSVDYVAVHSNSPDREFEKKGSSVNQILCNNIISPSHEICSILQSGPNMLFSERRKVLDNFTNRHAPFKHFQNLPYHNPSAFESWHSSANFCVCNNIVINFDSHNYQRDNYIYKDLYFSNILMREVL